LRHPRTNRLYQNCGGALDRILNDFDQLLGLIDGVVVGVNDLNLRAETRRCFRSGRRLLGLVIIVSGNERNNYI
jgi:hypothetical protein